MSGHGSTGAASALRAAALALTLLGLAACGIRGELEPPRGVEDNPEPDQVTSY